MRINQTADPSDYNFEVTEEVSLKSRWVSVASAVIDSDQSTVILMTKTRAVRGVRYSWASLSKGQFLYDSHGLPAPPFIASCPASSAPCVLIPSGKSPV